MTVENTDLAVAKVEIKESIEDVYKNTQTDFRQVCNPGDTACTEKWVAAFSDCV